MTLTRNRRFGLPDYWRMLVKRGPRLPLCYFLNAHLFDIANGVETHNWLPKEDFCERPKNFEHGVLYMCSWTNEIRRSFHEISRHIDNLSEYTFVDIGCGKGKVVLAWRQLLNARRIEQRAIGIDYYNPFVNTAILNHQKMFGTPGEFLFADAATLDYSKFNDKLIIYLYNPFDEIILDQIIKQCQNEKSYIVYNNPVHSQVLHTNGFTLISEHHGFHPNCQTKIFMRAGLAVRDASSSSPLGASCVNPARCSV